MTIYQPNFTSFPLVFLMHGASYKLRNVSPKSGEQQQILDTRISGAFAFEGYCVI